MHWIQLKLNTSGDKAEDIGDALVESGSVSVTFQDTHDVPVFEPLPGKPACGAILTSSACMMPKPT